MANIIKKNPYIWFMLLVLALLVSVIVFTQYAKQVEQLSNEVVLLKLSTNTTISDLKKQNSNLEASIKQLKEEAEKYKDLYNSSQSFESFFSSGTSNLADEDPKKYYGKAAKGRLAGKDGWVLSIHTGKAIYVIHKPGIFSEFLKSYSDRWSEYGVPKNIVLITKYGAVIERYSLHDKDTHNELEITGGYIMDKITEAAIIQINFNDGTNFQFKVDF